MKPLVWPLCLAFLSAWATPALSQSADSTGAKPADATTSDEKDDASSARRRGAATPKESDPNAPPADPAPTRRADEAASPGAPKGDPGGPAEDAAEEPQPEKAESNRSPARRAEEKVESAKQRARRSTADGKPQLAERLQALAAQWVQVVQAIERAAELEKEAAAVERQTLELESKTDKARSLLEQTEARRARAQARLGNLGLLEPGESPATALPQDTIASPSEDEQTTADEGERRPDANEQPAGKQNEDKQSATPSQKEGGR